MSQELSWETTLDDSEDKARQVVELLQNKLLNPPNSEKQEAWRDEVQELADRVPPQHLNHFLLRRLERQKVRIGKGVSFHRYMVQESEVRRMGLKSLSWTLDSKIRAYRFVDELEVRRPKVDLKSSTLEQVKWRCPGVLKATGSTGGRGAYLILSEDEIVHVDDGKRFSSQDEVMRHAHRLLSPRNGRPLRDRWIMEELILENRDQGTPARDVKFFAFYGEVLFVLEVIRGDGEPQYSFTRPDGTPVRPGGWDYRYFDGDGPTTETLELVNEISLEIPHPFMRIDMLKGEDGMVFGEFTPRPGRFQEFNPEWDRRMGEAWARAADRLQQDLLTGKRFDAFLSATKVYGS